LTQAHGTSLTPRAARNMWGSALQNSNAIRNPDDPAKLTLWDAPANKHKEKIWLTTSNQRIRSLALEGGQVKEDRAWIKGGIGIMGFLNVRRGIEKKITTHGEDSAIRDKSAYKTRKTKHYLEKTQEKKAIKKQSERKSIKTHISEGGVRMRRATAG